MARRSPAGTATCASWSVEDGAITGRTTAETKLKNNEFLIWRGGDVDDFELTFEYRIEAGNSGVQYRSFTLPEVAKWSVGGYQADFESGELWYSLRQCDRILALRGEKTVIGEDHKPRTVGSLGDAAELV